MNVPRPLIRRGYWCECWTRSPATGEAPVLLAAFDTTSPLHAVDWIRVALKTITPALDGETAGHAHDWLSGGHLAAVDDLRRGRACSFAIHHADTHVAWTARPVVFLALTHRRAVELPACAEWFGLDLEGGSGLAE